MFFSVSLLLPTDAPMPAKLRFSVYDSHCALSNLAHLSTNTTWISKIRKVQEDDQYQPPMQMLRVKMANESL